VSLPSPPVDEHGTLTYTAIDVRADLLGGLGGEACCVCGQVSVWSLRLRRYPGAAPASGWSYHGLHPRCVDTLMSRWSELLDSDDRPILVQPGAEVAVALTGAYARRAAGHDAPARTVTPRRAVLQRPQRPTEFVYHPGRGDKAGNYEARGTLLDGRSVIAPGLTEAEALRHAQGWLLLAQRASSLGPLSEVMTVAWVRNPDGSESERWVAEVD
jgi:hypothetical protein